MAFVESVAGQEPVLGAMIAWAPLELPEAHEHIERLRTHPLVKGVRRNTQHEPDRLFCSREGYVRGARRLGEIGYLCEICVRHEQIEAAVRLARASPDTTIVLEHLGKPAVDGPPPAYWLRAIDELAALPNVHCKISVVVHSDADPSYRAELLAPFVRHAVEAFGWGRTLFGSNWPVSAAVVGYRDWVDLLEAVLPSSSAADRAEFYAGNARRLYGLDEARH